jgi:hypothetical protein
MQQQSKSARILPVASSFPIVAFSKFLRRLHHREVEHIRFLTILILLLAEAILSLYLKEEMAGNGVVEEFIGGEVKFDSNMLLTISVWERLFRRSSDGKG